MSTPTLADLAAEYETSRLLIKDRMSELRSRLKETGGQMEKLRLEARLKGLKTMYSDTKTIAQMLEHVCLHRNRKDIQNMNDQIKSGRILVETHGEETCMEIEGTLKDILFNWTALTFQVCRKLNIPPAILGHMLPQLVGKYKEGGMKELTEVEVVKRNAQGV